MQPSDNGRESRSPVRYWELTSPDTWYVPWTIVPLSLRGREAEECVIPCSSSADKRSPIGLSGSLPDPVKDGARETAAATGRRKRSVDPLSWQFRRGNGLIVSAGRTEKRLDVNVIDAPSSLRQPVVARISSGIPSSEE